MATSKPLPELLVIAGPTASGKSSLALEIAKKYRGEIIAADSLTVRKGLDIGSAKPTVEQRQTVSHHLLDVAEPCEDFTAAVFKDLAVAAIADIAGRGNLPIIIGGTGLYIDSVLFDFQFLPAGDRKQREKLNGLSIAELLQQIEKAGIDTAGIDIRNKRRLIRLLETGGARPVSGPLRSATLIVGINPPKDELALAIERRVKGMVEAGLEKEVQGLKNRYSWGCEGLRGIGYHQWRDYFEGDQTLAETEKRIVKATLDLAKRQRTWLKRNPHIKWFDNREDAYVFLTKYF